jgi:hypothetical protein
MGQDEQRTGHDGKTQSHHALALAEPAGGEGDISNILEHARSGRGGGRRRCADAVCRVRGDGTGLRDLDNVWERHMPCERA